MLGSITLGHLLLKRKANAQKLYILLFICAVTRAIYLEFCTDVSATVLILAISRFSSRRGLPKLFASDNFKSLQSIEVKKFLLKSGIKWKGVSKQSTLQHYEKNIFMRDHAFYEIIVLLSATLS